MNSPLGGFTLLGGIIVIILLMAFIRSKIITAFLGLLLLAYILIHVKQVLPLIFSKSVAIPALKGV